jgi:hypothetical protein
LQGGLSRNKVAVGESAAGSPPNVISRLRHRLPSGTYNCLCQHGLIAQLVERRLCEAEAGGSNPPESTGTRVGVPDAPGDASHQGRAEGHRPLEAVYRCALRTLNGFSGVWQLCLSGDGSVRDPKKGVPSSDMPREGARSLRSGDTLMGHPSTLVLIRKDRERPELKHLSRGRKRNQLRCRE